MASSGIPVPSGTVVVSDGADEIAVWSFPNDPLLPGLASVLDGDKLRSLLSELGVPDEPANLRTRSYRPGRRAVVEVTTAHHRLFVKVVPPSEVAGLQVAHTEFARKVPVPRSLGWSGESGVIVFEALPGRTMRAALEEGRPLPGADDLTTLLDSLPELPKRRTRGPADLAAGYGRLIAAVLPEQAKAVATVVDGCAKLLDEELVPVHGDFHLSQVILDGGRIRGIVDIDGAGLGRRSDDLATLLGHVHTLGLESPRSDAIFRYGAGLIDAFDTEVDGRALRLRVAGALLGFATGPFRVQQADWPAATARRVEAALRWVESAVGA